jgi:hypothetical protein
MDVNMKNIFIVYFPTYTFTVILQVQGFIEIWKKEKKARSVSNFKLL